MTDNVLPQELERLIAALRDDDPDVRREAAHALGELGDERAVEALIAALSDEAPGIRRAAAIALGEIGDARAESALIELLSDTISLVREAAEDALAQIRNARAAKESASRGGVAAKRDRARAGESDRRPKAKAKRSLELSRTEQSLESMPVEDAAAPPEAPSPASFGAPAYAPLEDDTTPRFSTYYPAGVKAGQAYALMVFAHLESAREQVRQIAAGYAGLMGGQQQAGTAASTIGIDLGSLVTVVPQVAGVRFDPPEQVLAWQPPHQSATFMFTTPAALDSDLHGRVLVFLGPLIVGEIPVYMRALPDAAATAIAPDTESTLHHFDPVFASYSHRDTPVMEYFRRTRARLGQKMLVDIYDLRAGEHWQPRLLELIDQSAAFQLFWSKHSARSHYCRQEWQHACRHLASHPRFIQPVYWQANRPIPDPPPELAALHFQRVPVPALTRVQLALVRIRGLLRRA